MNRKNRWIAAALVLPGVLFVVFFMLIPLFSLCLTSFFPDELFSLSSYFSLFGDVYFQQVFVRSLRLSLLSTAVCALLGFPTAAYRTDQIPLETKERISKRQAGTACVLRRFVLCQPKKKKPTEE